MEEDIYSHIGRRIREERRKRGWTQEELAEKTDMHLSFIGQMERAVKKPSLKTLKTIAVVFGIKAGDLLDEGEPAKPYPIERKLTDLVRDQTPVQQKFLYETLKQLARQTKKIPRR